MEGREKKRRGEEGRGEERGEERSRERRERRERRGAEKGGYLKWKGHLKKGAVLHGTNNQRNIGRQRLHLVEAHDHLHLDI